jgi:hypothetical protein
MKCMVVIMSFVGRCNGAASGYGALQRFFLTGVVRWGSARNLETPAGPFSSPVRCESGRVAAWPHELAGRKSSEP